MRMGSIVKDPDVARAITITITDYRGEAIVSGVPAWTVANGLAIVGTPEVAGDVLSAIVDGGQEGYNYLVTCHVDFSSGANEEFTIEVRVRTGDDDPRLTR